MRILHVVHSLVPGEYRGGISKVAHELAASQARLGHQVDVFTTTLNSGVTTPIPAGHEAQFDGMHCTYFDSPPASGLRSYSPSLQRRLREVAADYDVLHGHNVCSHISRYVAQASSQSGTPAFQHLHGGLNPYQQQNWYRYLRRSAYVRLVERRQLRHCAKLFCHSEHEARHAEQQIGGGNTTLIPNGIRLPAETAPSSDSHSDAHSAFRQRHGLQDAQVILFLGRICDLKGVHLLAEAFCELTGPYPAARLVLAGNRGQFPDYVKRVDAILHDRGVHNRVTWTGFLGEQEKLDAFRAADIFCHPSETEGMPMSVLEAMAIGLPCVIGRGCHMDRAAQAGAVVETEFTSASVRRELDHCLRSHGWRRRLGKEAAVHVRQHHRWETVAQQTIDAYQEALSWQPTERRRAA